MTARFAKSVSGDTSAPLVIEPLNATRLAYIRCAIALAALAALYTEPSGPVPHAALTYVSIIAYCAYAIAIVFFSVRRQRPRAPKVLHWVDVACYSYLICLTEGTRSIFFYCFFFPIMAASLSHGYREGLRVTWISTASFLSLGTLATSWAGVVQPKWLVARSIFLLALGHLVAFWGGREIQHRRGLVFLQALNTLRNPRLDVDFTISQCLERLRDFYKGDNCVLVAGRKESEGGYAMYSCDAGKKSQFGEVVSKEISERLLGPDDCTAVSYDPREGAWGRRARCVAWDVSEGVRRSKAPAAWCAETASLLDTRCFISAPYLQSDDVRGRLFVAAKTGFSMSDAMFLLQFSAALAIQVENTRLIEELLATASERERSRMSLDIHDSTIQPYVALRMGLDALYREVDEASSIRPRLRELLDMTDLTLHDLREFASGLRQSGWLPGEGLFAAVREQAARYERFYGLRVEVEIDGVPPRGSLASDIYQIIVEGLSNIRRHTKASRAYVRVARDSSALSIEIGNETDGRAHSNFAPRSIQARAQSLGGTVSVGLKDGYTRVSVTVPV